jgi:hypothetical protein
MSTMAGAFKFVAGMARKAGSSPPQQTVLVAISDIDFGGTELRGASGHAR